MSSRTAQRVLWLALAVACPVPVLLLDPGWVPPGRLLMLGGLTLALGLVETTRGAVGLLAAILLGQGLLYVGLSWVVAFGTARLLARLPRPAVAVLTLAIVVAGLLGASRVAVYRDPYRRDAARTTLLHVYE